MWRFVVEENSNRKSFINKKYGSNLGVWFSKISRGICDVGMWKVIAEHLEQVKNDCEFVLGPSRIVSR